MTRAQIEDLEAFADEVAQKVVRGVLSIEQAIHHAAEPYLLAPIGCHRDGDSIQIRDQESGEHTYFTKNDQGELWVHCSHRNGARINPEQFLWLAKEFAPWLDGKDLS